MKLSSVLIIPLSLFAVTGTAREQECEEESCNSNNDKSNDVVSNAKFLDYSMMYYDSVAFLISNDLGIPQWMHEHAPSTVTPTQLAGRFHFSVRGASAMLATLCRMNVVHVAQDNDDSVDLVSYRLSDAAKQYLADPTSTAYTGNFFKIMSGKFFDPPTLLEMLQKEPEKDLMNAHLEREDDDGDSEGEQKEEVKELSPEEEQNVRVFTRAMHSHSYDVSMAFSVAMNEDAKESFGPSSTTTELTMLDVGGGSGIYTISSVQANENWSGIVMELATTVPITQEYVNEANLQDRISVVKGNFFTNDPFPKSNLVLCASLLQNFPDDANHHILELAYDSIEPQDDKTPGRIVISDYLLADDVASSSVASTSVNLVMIGWTKGRQYRAKELFTRLMKVGFVNPRVRALAEDGVSLVIADKPLTDIKTSAAADN